MSTMITELLYWKVDEIGLGVLVGADLGILRAEEGVARKLQTWSIRFEA